MQTIELFGLFEQCEQRMSYGRFVNKGYSGFLVDGVLGRKNHSSGNLVDKVPVQAVKRL